MSEELMGFGGMKDPSTKRDWRLLIGFLRANHGSIVTVEIYSSAT
jgi:hypothetical protein